ncbi:MAG: methylated-DNA--[protein]-cysteine S-methyltransferase [Planktotalea sp.]|uniref:methylated-DNA--[protein]-cysteine S-methyltransferase n=1 Tax=Planktotalea sp. TaxID=2029877 RepID=UPI003C7698F8
MEQLGFNLGAEPLPEVAPAFKGAADFARHLNGWLGASQKAAKLFAHPIETPLGTMVAICDATHLHLLEFADRKELPKELAKLAAHVGVIAPGQSKVTRQVQEQLARYFAGKLKDFDLPLALHGTEFTTSVWRALQAIPYGETRSYGAQAEALGNPTATRAVARANGSNQIAIVIPCHRVIGADGALTGYAGGVWRKRALLELEAG